MDMQTLPMEPLEDIFPGDDTLESDGGELSDADQHLHVLSGDSVGAGSCLHVPSGNSDGEEGEQCNAC